MRQALAGQADAMQRPSIWLPAREQHGRAEKLIGYWAYEGTLHRCSLLSCSMGARPSLARQKRSIPAFPASLAHGLILHPSSQARDLVQASNQGAVACGEPGLGSCNQPITP